MDVDSFITTARSMLNTPFRHQGRSVKYGVDCIGLVIVAAKLNGIDTSTDYTTYPRRPYGQLIPALDNVLVKVEDRKPGDILVFCFQHEPMHVGIWTGSTLIHTYSSVGKVVEHHMDTRWEKRVIATYRIKEYM